MSLDQSDQEFVDRQFDTGSENTLINLEPRYTISFINGQPGLVIRENTPEMMDEAIRKILPVFKKFRAAFNKAQKSTQSAPNASSEVTAFCSTHNVQMAQGISRRTNKPYFYHDGPEGEGRCFGKGYLKQ